MNLIKNAREAATDFLNAQYKSTKKTVPVLVLSEENTSIDIIAGFAHKIDLGVVTIEAINIQDYFKVDEQDNLNTSLFDDKIREAKLLPCVLVIDRIQLVTRQGARIVRALAHAATTESDISWLAPGSCVIFMDYLKDTPRPFFLSDCEITVLSL